MFIYFLLIFRLSACLEPRLESLNASPFFPSPWKLGLGASDRMYETYPTLFQTWIKLDIETHIELSRMPRDISPTPTPTRHYWIIMLFPTKYRVYLQIRML